MERCISTGSSSRIAAASAAGSISISLTADDTMAAMKMTTINTLAAMMPAKVPSSASWPSAMPRPARPPSPQATMLNSYIVKYASTAQMKAPNIAARKLKNVPRNRLAALPSFERFLRFVLGAALDGALAADAGIVAAFHADHRAGHHRSVAGGAD